MRPQEIVDMITGSERFAQTHAFEDRVYGDEPILRTGAQAYGDLDLAKAGIRPRQAGRAEGRPKRYGMPALYRKMRALERKAGGGRYRYGASISKLFYEQAKLMEDFEDDFEGECQITNYVRAYEDMSDYQLRCYFSWRTRLRHGEKTYAPSSFVLVHAYELLCGIGTPPSKEGHDQLVELYDTYGALSESLEYYLSRWIYDYVVFYGLDRSLLEDEYRSEFPYELVTLLLRAQEGLIARKASVWPNDADDMPGRVQVLDALASLSRYRAEKSKFIKEKHDDVAQVACDVFVRMVNHCHKRRKVDFVEGLFGRPMRYSYSMFPSALFWQALMHKDTEYVISDHERFLCESGFWYKEVPCSRSDTSKELGNLLHAIDTRMRAATDYGHPLKARSLPKYQVKMVDGAIASFVEQRKAEEAARISIDRASLTGIRSAAARTREALLTDEEREDEAMVESQEPVQEPAVVTEAQNDLGLTAEQLALLIDLLDGKTPTTNSLFLSLAVDAINEAFLDIVGDTVVEFDGDTPTLVEDYKPDVQDALSVE